MNVAFFNRQDCCCCCCCCVRAHARVTNKCKRPEDVIILDSAYHGPVTVTHGSSGGL